MKTYTKEQLKEILDLHAEWLRDPSKGKKADLSGVDLRETNLVGVDLRYANITEADLREANLTGADLRHADLGYAHLISANLMGADLTGANLRGADLRETNLSYTYITSLYLKHHVVRVWINSKDKQMVKIGYLEHTIDYWIKNGKLLGKRYDYKNKDIKLYLGMLKLLKANHAS